VDARRGAAGSGVRAPARRHRTTQRPQALRGCGIAGRAGDGEHPCGAGGRARARDTHRANEAAAVLQQLENPANTLELAVGGARIKLTNLDRVYWPATPRARHRPPQSGISSAIWRGSRASCCRTLRIDR